MNTVTCRHGRQVTGGVSSSGGMRVHSATFATLHSIQPANRPEDPPTGLANHHRATVRAFAQSRFRAVAPPFAQSRFRAVAPPFALSRSRAVAPPFALSRHRSRCRTGQPAAARRAVVDEPTRTTAGRSGASATLTSLGRITPLGQRMAQTGAQRDAKSPADRGSAGLRAPSAGGWEFPG